MTCRFRTISVLLVASATLIPLAASDGTLAIATGPAQIGTAGAGGANPQDATWMSLNPADITLVRSQVDIGSEVAHSIQQMTPAGPAANPGAGTMDDHSTEALPYALASVRCEHGAWGLGVDTVGGLGIQFPRSRTVFGALGGGYDRTAQLAYYRAILAYAVTCDGWNAGIAIDGDYSRFRSDFATSSLSETAGKNQTDHAAGAGFQIGIQRQWGPFAADLSYTSRQWMQRFKAYSDLFTSLDLPQIARIGVAYRVLPWLEPVLDYRFINWRGVSAYGNNNSLGWKNQHVVALGATADLNELWVLRAGVSYGNSPITADTAFVNAVSPLISTFHATAGVGWHASHLRADLAVLEAFRRTLTDNGNDAGGAGRGTKESFELTSVAAGVGYMF